MSVSKSSGIRQVRVGSVSRSETTGRLARIRPIRTNVAYIGRSGAGRWILFLLVLGLLAGMLVGIAGRALVALAPGVRWAVSGGILFFGAGAYFITTFSAAEREHELKLAACSRPKLR